MRRLIDILLAVFLFGVLIIPILVIAIVLTIKSTDSVLYWSNRVGQNNVIFKMPKFRTMRSDAPNMASHLVKDPMQYFLPMGGFLRRTSLDELPQLFSIIKGDMTFVGPRPALFNQDDLIQLRVEKKVDILVPGITGWAQINGRDELYISEKVNLDVEYMKNKSFFFDIKIIFITLRKVIKTEGVAH